MDTSLQHTLGWLVLFAMLLAAQTAEFVTAFIM